MFDYWFITNKNTKPSFFGYEFYYVLMFRIFLLFITILLFSSKFSFSQSGLYSIMVNWSPNERKLATLNPNSTSGLITQISPGSIFDWYLSSASTTIDENNGIYYTQVQDPTQPNFWLLVGIDLVTGAIVSNVTLPNSHEMHQMVFNCKDSSIYAIMVQWSPNERHLVKINPTNGQVTVISPYSIFEWYNGAAETTIDPENNIYYVETSDDPQSNIWLLKGIDLTTGLEVSSVQLPNSHEWHQIKYNCMDSTLYTIMVNWSPNERHLAKINPNTGVVSVISPTSIFEWYVTAAGTTIDPQNNIFYAQVTDDPQSGFWQLYGIDLTTGTVISNNQMPTSHEFHQMVFNPLCDVPLDFTYNNTCIGNTTEFYSTGCAGTYQWDFGDPASTNNFSDLQNPIHVYSDTGYYDVKLVWSSCCERDSITQTIYVDTMNQVAMLPNDANICEGDTVLLDASYLSGTYYWQDSSSTSTFQVTDPGVYWISEDVCNTIDSITFTNHSFQNFGLGNDTSMCTGSILLDPGDQGGNYLWQDGSTNQQFVATSPGQYSVDVVDSVGCTRSDTVEIIVGSISVDLGNDTFICSGSAVLLDATTTGSTYLWQNGSTSAILTADTSGQYTVLVQKGFCETSDTLQLTVDTPIANFTLADTVGCPPVLTHFFDQSVSNEGTIVDWTWNFGDNFSSTLQNPTHIYGASGMYQVELTVSTNNGCSNQFERTVEMEIYDQPEAAFFVQSNPGTSGDQLLFSDQSTLASSWEWFFDNSTFSNEQNPLHVFTDAGEYTVLLIASNDYCSDTSSQVIVIKDVTNYYVPNAFTPDGDEKNQVFRPVFTPGYEPLNYKLTIVNRRGAVIFESLDVMTGWDGTHKGKLSQDGTYIWMLEFTEQESGQHRTNTGHVNLLR